MDYWLNYTERPSYTVNIPIDQIELFIQLNFDHIERGCVDLK